MNPRSPAPKQLIPLERLRGGNETNATGRKVRPVTAPNLSPAIHSLECGEPNFREPEDGEWIVALYREDDGTLVPLLLWADPNVDLFWDVARREHVKPPKLYVRLAEQPQLDPATGYPIIGGAVCPF